MQLFVAAYPPSCTLIVVQMGVDLCTHRTRIGLFSVRHKPRYSSVVPFSDSSHFILALCPRPSLGLLSVCFALLLLQAGDVETNPGPKIDDVLVFLREFREEVATDINDVKEQVANLNTRITAIESKISSVQEIQDHFDAVRTSVHEVKANIRKTNDELIDVVDDISNRMRRNNLIIKGIPENGQEGYAESETIVKDFCSTHLKINVGDIERAHRIGQRRPGFHRPIIIKFLNFKTKTEVLRNAPKLKNLDFPKVWIEEDFSPKVQLARRKLREYARSNREGTEPFSIRYNSLHLKGSIYRYDPVKDNIVEVPTRNQSSRT